MKFSAILSLAMFVAVSASGSDDDSGGKSGKGRRAEGVSDLLSNERVWAEYKNTCAHVDYDVKFVVVSATGHLEGYAAPHGDAPAACVPIVGDVITQTHSGKHYKRVQALTADEQDFWAKRVSYEMGVRPLSDIAAAIELIHVNESATYMSKLVPKNCGSFMLELGKLLNLPIDSDVVSFVVANMASTSFMGDFSSSTAYQMLSVESWFGNTRRLGATGSDAESMVRRLFEYMIDQQYPKELVKIEN